jgi:hypothetical protein
MTLPIPRAVREFCDSVRVISESLPTLLAVKDALDKLMRAVEVKETDDLYDAIKAERDAHNETKQTLETMGEQFRAAFETESAARKEAERKLDALTRWLDSKSAEFSQRRNEPGWSSPANATHRAVTFCAEEILRLVRFEISTPESIDATEKAKEQ